MMAFFEGCFCFVASFFNNEHREDYLADGYNIYRYLREEEYYLWISVFLGILYIGKILYKF